MAAIAETKSLEKDLNGMKQHSTELCKTVKVLENQVKEKANTVKVKDAACMKFKKEKEEIENALQKAVQDHQPDVKQKKPAKKFKCDFCDIYMESGFELGQHFRRNHYKDQVCQTSECETSDEPSKLSTHVSTVDT